MSKYKNIIEAAKDLSLDDVKYFVEEKGEDVNQKKGSLLAETINHKHRAIHLVRSPEFPDHELKEKALAEIVAYLISKGADVNLYGKGGETLLHLAASTSSVEVVKILVSNGADVNTLHLLSTPLDAAKLSTIDSAEKMSVLREAGGKTNHEVRSGGSGSGSSSGCLVLFAAFGALLMSGICGLMFAVIGFLR